MEIKTLQRNNKDELVGFLKELEHRMGKLSQDNIILKRRLNDAIKLLDYSFGVIDRINERLMKFSQNHITVTNLGQYKTPYNAIFTHIGFTHSSHKLKMMTIKRLKKWCDDEQ